ncbi:MAG TPA: radical SAM protein [Casimicrobiaceae bacterium]|nr:radical SAM protein [Casimicrobiaceae bacterium]
MSIGKRPVDEAAFERLRRIAPNLLHGRDDETDWHARALPDEVAFKLTNRCDLRCAHCYQWHPQGYHRQLAPVELRTDLDLAIIAAVLDATRPVQSNVYLWGGEPFVYRDWDALMDLLAAHQRWTSICTNGTLLERRLASLEKLGQYAEISVSLDGFEAQHDAVRGRGAFARTWRGVEALRERRRAGAFAGQLTINFVVTDAMVGGMFDFVTMLDAAGVDTLYVSLPWYLAADGAARMDAYFDRHYGWPRAARASWHSYSYGLDPACIDELRAQIARIDAGEFRAAVRYNPRLDDKDLLPFVLGSDTPAQNKVRCQSTRARMDVFPNGDVVSCKFFPEFRVGNLHEADFASIWHGERFDQVRRTVATCGLMPACAKCNLLYTRGM